jgi:hypothetical protein
MTTSWTDRNPARPGNLPHIPFERLRAGVTLKGVITCTAPYDSFTHYLGGRTLPCSGTEDCPGCGLKRKGWELYLSLWTVTPSKHVITALTPSAARELSDAAPDPNDLRGYFIELRRINTKNNGRMLCSLDQPEFKRHGLPPAPDVRAHMYKIWGLDPDEISNDHPLFDVRAAFTLPMENLDGTRPGTTHQIPLGLSGSR